MLFDVGLKGEMGEFGDYFKTWNWELGFRYSRDEAINLSQGVVSAPGLREALLDTDPATAFNPFLNFNGVNQQTAIARARVYVTLHDTAIFETPLAYFNLNGDLFNLPAGPVSFAVGAEYRGERYEDTPDSLNTTFNSIGSTDLEASRVNRDVWGFYQEVRIPVTSPTWNFPGAYSLEFDLAEREEWYSQNTAATSVVASGHSQFDTQRPKFSVRWQPFDQELTRAWELQRRVSCSAVVRDFACVNPELPGDYRSTLSIRSGFTPDELCRWRSAKSAIRTCNLKLLMNGPTDWFTARNGSRA